MKSGFAVRPALGLTARTVLALAVAVLALALLAGPARAATITVTTPGDDDPAYDLPDGDCSLREAVEAADTDAVVDACPAGAVGCATR